jgi:taurine dioxygenase
MLGKVAQGMAIEVTPLGKACGAAIRGVDLRHELSVAAVAEVRAAWLAHQVIAFPDQQLTHADLERFASYFGPSGDDPYIAPIAGHPRVVEVRREPDEKAPIFAETWHSDWSFLDPPPQGTALYGSIIPQVGGDTCFANQYAAYEALSESMRSQVDGKVAIHSARRGYARDGMYGEKDVGRSMAIRFSDSAMGTQRHPLVRVHPETGRKALFVSMGYTIGIEGMGEADANALLFELFAHQVREEFVYRHTWHENMLVLWDNRCLLHRASGGYEGHRRLLFRITIGDTRRGSARARQA